MNRDCVSPAQAKVMRAAVIGAIKVRKLRQKDVTKLAGVRPQHVYDVLQGDKPISLRMHAAFKRALRKAYPELN